MWCHRGCFFIGYRDREQGLDGARREHLLGAAEIWIRWITMDPSIRPWSVHSPSIPRRKSMDGFTTVLAGVTRLRLQYTLYFRNPSIRPYIFLQKYICTDIGYIETLWISMQPRFGDPSMDVWTDFSKYAFNRPLSRVTPAESAIVAVHTLWTTMDGPSTAVHTWGRPWTAGLRSKISAIHPREPCIERPTVVNPCFDA